MLKLAITGEGEKDRPGLLDFGVQPASVTQCEKTKKNLLQREVCRLARSFSVFAEMTPLIASTCFSRPTRNLRLSKMESACSDAGGRAQSL